MENKVAAGSLLLHNVSHGIMSNVESSLYLYDLSHCLNALSKNLLINWSAEVLLDQKKSVVFKDHPIILINTRDLRKDLFTLKLHLSKSNESFIEEIVLVQSQGFKLEVTKMGPKLVVIDARPQVINKKNGVYARLKEEALTKKESFCAFLLQLVKDVQQHFKMGKSALIIDSLEKFYILSRCQGASMLSSNSLGGSSKTNELLKMMKNISLQQPSIFPFIVHCDFSMIQ